MNVNLVTVACCVMSNYCHKSVLFGMLGMLRDEQCGDDYDDDGQISAV